MQKTQLALFPLQLFLLPGESTRLHIFEERYKQLLSDYGGAGASFGIPFTEKGILSGLGSLVEVSKVIREYPNGSADIEVRCTDLFKIEQFFIRMGEKLYPGGDVVIMESDAFPPISDSLFKALDSFIKEHRPEQFKEILSPHLNVIGVARILQLDEGQKMKLVRSTRHENMEKLLLNQINVMNALYKQHGSIQGNLFLN